MEREARTWSYEGLATRMAQAGCPIQPSAIYKIEKADPPRRITVDELLGFAAAFEMSVVDLLRPREVVVSSRLARLFDKWEAARQEALQAQRRADEAFHKMSAFVQQNHGDALRPFYDMLTDWSAGAGDSEEESAVLQAMVLASAVPVEPFKQLEREALDALRIARESGQADG